MSKEGIGESCYILELFLIEKRVTRRKKRLFQVGQWKSDEMTDIYRPSPDRRYFGKLALLSCLIAWLCWGIWGGWIHHHAMRLGRANHLRKPFLKYVWWLVVGEWILVLLTFFLVAWLVGWFVFNLFVKHGWCKALSRKKCFCSFQNSPMNFSPIMKIMYL